MGKASRKKHQQRHQKNVIEKYGNVKLSDAISYLCEPHEQSYNYNETGYRNLIMLAVFAWNIALKQDLEIRENMITEFLENLLKQSSTDFGTVDLLESETAQTLRGLHSIMNEFISRKDLYYPNDDRVIIDFTLRPKGSGYYLQIKSIIPQRNAD